MSSALTISIGQYSDKGRKDTNQDFHGVMVPDEPQLSSKGIAIALADGISSSSVSQVASQFAVTGFLEDYYCTSEAWSVKTSAERVLAATNAWLYSQTQQSQWRYDKDRGYVCTLSAMVIKSTTAYVFHAGDTRIYRLRGNALEQLTRDHRVQVSQDQSYLARALGINQHLEIDFQTQEVEVGDMFVLATDGVYEFASAGFIVKTIRDAEHAARALGTPERSAVFDTAAQAIAAEALTQGSDDNQTIQILRIDELPNQRTGEVMQHGSSLPAPPILDARMEFDGYTIIREVHGSSRSHIYLAVDGDTGATVILKTPSIDLQGNAAYLERFMMEEWVARRVDSAHVLRPCAQTRKRNFLYVVTEFIEGKTLTMDDRPAETRSRIGTRHRRANRQRPARVSPP